jgi:sugar phosphate isomerase/epimerase
VKGISRRARTCAVVAATGVAVLAGSTAANAQRPASLGAGLPVGQTGTQMFNYNRFITGTAAEQAAKVEQIFAMLQSKGIRIVEPYNLHGMTAAQMRTLADKYDLKVVGRHGGVAEGSWDGEIATAKTLGQEFIGSGGTASPGQGTYAQTLATAATLNRLGKRSVEAGVGKVYIHNHTAEFEAKYDVNGTIKTSWEILMDNTDSRWVAAEVDAGWASDAPVDVVDLLTRYPTRIEMMHVKDLTNIAPAGRSGNPVQLGTGEINYGPIFAAAKGKVKWFHYELDPPNSPTFDALQTARNSFDAVRGEAAPALYGAPPKFNAEPAAPTGAAAPVPVKVENLGDAPLAISAVTIQAPTGEPAASATDFTITSQTCTTGPLAPGTPPSGTNPGTKPGSCTVFVRFNPRRALTTSIARLQFTSNADDATDRVQLLATSGASISTPVAVGGEVPGIMSLTLNPPVSFGTFTPGTARDYTSSLLAEVTTTTPDATLSVTDPGAVAAGHLVNGTVALQQALKARATNTANPATAFASLSEAGAPLPLLTYSGPTTKDTVSLGFQQSIGATETLLRGSYSKTLTFTLSSTTP